jgi:hypothetical protein
MKDCEWLQIPFLSRQHTGLVRWAFCPWKVQRFVVPLRCRDLLLNYALDGVQANIAVFGETPLLFMRSAFSPY